MGLGLKTRHAKKSRGIAINAVVPNPVAFRYSSKYMPHQGKQEIARRKARMAS